MAFHFRITSRFMAGVLFLVLSLTLGVISKIIFVLHFQKPVQVWISIGVYIFSWLLMFMGIWLAGYEYFLQMKRFVSYGFYKESLKKGAHKAIHGTRTAVQNIRQRRKDNL